VKKSIKAAKYFETLGLFLCIILNVSIAMVFNLLNFKEGSFDF
jgi:hypothetical protein